MRQLFRELKRRNVYKVAVTYAVVAFVGLQAVDLLIPATTLPAWADELLVALAVFGFPLALVLAWAFEMTPEGMRRTPTTGEPDEATESAPMPPEERRAQSRLAMKALVGLGLVGAAVAGGWYLMGGGGESPATGELTVAVLPFQVSGSGAESWRDGMVTMLSVGLDGAVGLRAIADRTVLAVWEDSGVTGGAESTDQALAVSRRIGAAYAVVGSAVQLGSDLRFSASIHETSSGARLGQVEVRGSPDSVPSLADALTRRVVGVLAEEGRAELPAADLASVTTHSLPALKAYLEGERNFRAGDFQAAIEDYRDAIDRDSTFALAHWRLATSFGWLGSEGESSPIDYRERAYELSGRLPRRERRLLQASWLARNRYQEVAAVDSLQRLAAAYPDDPAVWYELGDVILHAGLPGGWPEADGAFSRAVELDPGHAPYQIHHLQLAFALHHDSSLAADRAARHPNPRSIEPWFPLAMDLVFGTPERRRQAVARLDTVRDLDAISPGTLAWTLAHPADGALQETLARKYAPVDPLARLSLVHTLLWRGRIDEVLGLLSGSRLTDEVACSLADAQSLGIPIPDSLLRTRLGPSGLEDDASIDRLLCAGIYLAERKRYPEFARLTARMKKAASDTGGKASRRRAQASAALDVIRGYRAWKAGELERAARWLSSSVYVPATGIYSSVVRGLWRGDVYRELDDLRTAEGWYLTVWWNPLAHERLGQLYEEMGEPEKAVAAYRRFIAAWEDADPELQDRVGAARGRLQALATSGAESGD